MKGSDMYKFELDIDNLTKIEESKITTGFDELNKYLIDFAINNFIITIASRPAVGKTSFANSICNHLLKQGKKLLYISLSDSKNIIEKKFVKNFCNNLHADIEEYKNAIKELKNSNLSILAKANLTIEDLESAIEETKPEYIVIDEIQQFRLQKDLLLDDIVFKIKELTQKYNLCTFILSQISRAVEKRTDKRPLLVDIKNTTQLEEISDLVAVIYRENYYNLESENNSAEIIIRKNNFGSLGSFELNFKDSYFENKDIEF